VKLTGLPASGPEGPDARASTVPDPATGPRVQEATLASPAASVLVWTLMPVTAPARYLTAAGDDRECDADAAYRVPIASCTSTEGTGVHRLASRFR
jgi:hypothetical protein